ncbi:MAG: tRNA uridine-5-carboxymethylaminomethyl(34) synthesis GTPase MnmE [Oscillospiraceae bacterium]|nr:tRNA uridine-5-carboxymethylaminomethyl(34) synthesis GTPase MnmE [Oscillospiraceae bacterium]
MPEPAVAAISTPFGQGGISAVRISGEEAIFIAERVFAPFSGKALGNMKGYTAAYGFFFEGSEKIRLDTGIALVYKAPKSYTGENVVELSCHGGIFIARKILRLILENGAKMAEAGEFTKRAFLNGKLSLTQAEAVTDLISASSERSLKMAVSASQGKLWSKIRSITEKLLDLSAYFSAWFDFPEEDIPELSGENILAEINSALLEISALIEGYDQGRLVREGIFTVIAGKPNVGKSTLMNLLSGEERSIVTDVPGTTRDFIEENVLLGDYVLRLVDTAGIRRTDDSVERIGVLRAEEKLRVADIVLALFDASEELDESDRRLLEKLDSRNTVIILNKSDIGLNLETSFFRANFEHVVVISARKGEGLDSLKAALESSLRLGNFDTDSPSLANERQLECARNAYNFLKETESLLSAGESLDAVSVMIEAAADSLLQLTGERTIDKTIDAVFAKFCVGK